MPNSRFYSSTAAVTNLQATAGPADATVQVASSSGFPGSFPFTLSLDYGSANEELVDVTGGGPSVFNVTRAVDGTSASTHNAGAVVRHVTSARDFTDSRTHEASSTGVHGITGAFVDTNSTQTLNNKTLANPTINNATVTGTVTATGATVSNGSLSGSTLLNGKISGTLSFQSGPTASGDWSNAGIITNTGELRQQNLLRGSRANTSDSQYETRVTGDTNSRWYMTADGAQRWGSGAAASDTSLLRSAAGTMQVGTNLAVIGNLSAGGNATVTGSLSVPTVTGNPVFSGNPRFTGAPTFTPTTAVDEAVLTGAVAAGWSIDSCAARKAGGVTTVSVHVERVGSNIVASASGNIADTVVGTLAAGFRPIDGTMITNYDMSGIATGSVSIGNDGIVTIKSLSAGNTIGLGDTVNFSLTWANNT